MVRQVIEGISNKLPPVRGKIGGTGQFAVEEMSERVPVFATFDSPGLESWRSQLLSALDAVGVGMLDGHGYQPHITLAYWDEPGNLPVLDGRELILDSLSLVWDGRREDYSLTGTDVKGGPGSGHHGHTGRPGKRGGSAAGTSTTYGAGTPPSKNDTGISPDGRDLRAEKMFNEGLSTAGVSLAYLGAEDDEVGQIKDGIVTGLSERSGESYEDCNA
ncbi:unnamed protein product, partial [marine sediment metagenome]